MISFAGTKTFELQKKNIKNLSVETRSSPQSIEASVTGIEDEVDFDDFRIWYDVRVRILEVRIELTPWRERADWFLREASRGSASVGYLRGSSADSPGSFLLQITNHIFNKN